MSARKTAAGDGPYPLPEGWRWVKLGRIISLAKSARAGGKSFPILSMTMHGGLVDQESKFKKQIASNDLSSYKVVLRGQLVVGFPIDEGVLDFQSLYESAIVSPAYQVWNLASEDLIDREYLSIYLRSPSALSYYRSKLQSTTARRRSLNRSDFLNFQVPVPSMCEQRRIVKILDSVSEISTKSTRREELIRALRISMFREMFPEDTTATIPLGKICKLHSGSTPSKKESRYWNDQIPWFSAKDLKATELYDSQDHVSQDALDETSLKLRPADSIAMVVRGMILAHTFPVSILRTTSATNQDLKVIEPIEGINTEFLAAALKSRSQWVLDRALTSAHGTKRLEMSLLESIPIPDVSTEEQDLFAAQVAQIRALAASSLDLDTSLSKMLINLQSCAFRGKL